MGIVPPSIAPVISTTTIVGRDEPHWSRFDKSVNAVSFGLVATASLISMFLVMAIFERFRRPRSSPASDRIRGDLEAQMSCGKLYPSPKMTIYARGVSVLMPGEETPTFIAQLLPLLHPVLPNVSLNLPISRRVYPRATQT